MAVVTFVLALMNFAVPTILQVKVFPVEMWIRFNTSFDVPGTLKLGWPLVVAPLLLLVCFMRRGLPWPHREAAIAPEFFRQQLGRPWFYACGFGSILLCVTSVGLPLLQILCAARTWTELPGAFAAGQSAIWNSFWFASLGAAAVIWVSVVIRTLSAGFNRRNMRIIEGQRPSLMATLPNLFSVLVWLAFLLPGVLLGIVLITVFNRPWFAWFYQSAAIIILAYGIRYFALGWTCILRANQSVDSHLLDIAELEGATPWQKFQFVQWPQIAPRVAAAWYVVFLLCLWDIESIILVVPPGGETLAVRIFNLLHYGHNAQVNALCLTLVGIALVPLILWQFWSALRASFLTTIRNTFHPTHAVLLLLLLGIAGLLISCAPSSQSNEAAIQSKLFSRVQIIGSRGAGVGQLNKPRSVAVDAQDNLYVVDMTGRVQKFSSNGVFLLSWQMPQTDLGKPKGMCRDRTGNIVVLEPHYSRVNHFTPSGELVLQWGQRGTNSGQLSLPRAVAVNSQNEIFVSEYQEAERVQKFDLDSISNTSLRRGNGDIGHSNKSSGSSGGTDEIKKTDKMVERSAAPSDTLPKQGANQKGIAPRWLDSIGKAGTGPGDFNRPEGLCVDNQDLLYVADSCNHRIQVFSSDGKYLRRYGKPGKGSGELSYPYDICVDSLGRQYVCEFGNGRIQVFDAHDHPLEIIGGPGAEPGRFSNPWGVALDSAGNLYVADSQNHRVQKFIRKPANEIAGSP
jgi:DNA-binding beta-propeller fold protein YncE/ABC-type spermidine/putrescine transport system permease subunit II